MTETLFDIVVVGDRPIDQVLAILPGQTRHRVTVFEWYFTLYPLQHVSYLNHEVLYILLSNFFSRSQMQTIFHRQTQTFSTLEIHLVWEAIAATLPNNSITLCMKNGEKRE